LLLENTLQSARRLFEIAGLPPAVRESAQAIPAPERFNLRVEHLSFGYPDSQRLALDDFSLVLPVGGRVALVGPSGAGKSTLVNLLLRFWEAPPGSVWIDGREIGSIRIASLRGRMAIIPQNVYLFSGSLEENVRLANPQATGEMVGAALRQAGLGSLVERLPGGLKGWVGAQGEQLSGGERQRVGVARALLRSSDLLIWDEPTPNLDAISARKLLGELTGQIGRRSLLWITHDLVGLEGMDEIIVLREGRILEHGRNDDLISKGGWYAEALALQRRLMI
ncbi:MAG TPA: ATP-binding cassette domain-containing protein, partial [Anaerolinea sp.]|nr:ATP-binding cassette domain-containing protein [Anaerolinea sp.]